jgi:D-alanyl-D-alanine-carboxypeptidase/D-alanyl-D-alanine-endopeptidase
MIRKMTAALGLASALALGAASASAQTPPPSAAAKPWVVPSDAEIRRILADRIDTQHQGVGIVVGVIDAKGRRIVSYGVSDKADGRPVDQRTIFEIGSMSKVFTSLLLADMVQRGEVKLDDPISKYLPTGVKVPERGGKQITLIDLATHSSGLPRLPTNMAPKDPGNPYADYTVAQLYAFLASYSLPRDIGSQYEYSNLGGGLLGHVLALRAGTDYATLVRQRITGPLGMTSTTIALTPEEKTRLAIGHDAALAKTSNWDIPTLAGAGALRSDADDILTFLGAELGYVKAPLAPAMKAQIAPRRPAGSPNLQVALGWHVITSPAGEIVWHNGGTGGYRTMMAFDPKAGVGVVVLSNTSTQAGVDDIALHLLVGAPLMAPPVQHQEIAVDPAALKGLVGRYQIAPQVAVEMSLEGGQFYTQMTGQQRIPVYMEAPHRAFLKVVEATIDFDVDASGRATALTIHQNGRDVRASRIEEAPSK